MTEEAQTQNVKLPEPAAKVRPMGSVGQMTDDRIMEIAHRTATRYTHRSDPTESSYGFMRHTLLDFARKVLEEAAADQVRAAVLQERERCARVAENTHPNDWAFIAAAIRSGS